MIYLFIKLLNNIYSIHNIEFINYKYIRYIMSFILSIFITIIYGNKFISWIYKKNIKENIRELGLYGQNEKEGTPSMGGIIIIISTLFSVFIFSQLNNIYIIILIISTLWLGVIGFIDDYIKIFKKNKNGLNPIFKIIGQLILSLFISSIMYYNKNINIKEKIKNIKYIDIFNINNTTISFEKSSKFDYFYIIKFFELKNSIFLYILFTLLIIFIIISVSNGANITDGIDGLTAGISSIIIATLIILSYISSSLTFSSYLNLFYIPKSTEIVIFLSSLFGSLMGFIWYNAYPAQIFMGDVGSLTIGGLIAIVSILIRKEFLIPILCGIFFIENLSVLIQVFYFKYSKIKYGIGYRIFNMAPIHHHFQIKGYHENKIVTRCLIIQFLLSIISMMIIRI